MKVTGHTEETYAAGGFLNHRLNEAGRFLSKRAVLLETNVSIMISLI